jgi:hypothetical protein
MDTTQKTQSGTASTKRVVGRLLKVVDDNALVATEEVKTAREALEREARRLRTIA